MRTLEKEKNMLPLFIGAAILLLMRQDPTVKRVKEGLDQWETDDDVRYNYHR